MAYKDQIQRLESCFALGLDEETGYAMAKQDAAEIAAEADARIAELEGALHSLKVIAEPFLNSSDPHEPGEQVLNQAQKALNNGPR